MTPCSRLTCPRTVADEDYLTWLAPPIRDGEPYEPTCSQACAWALRDARLVRTQEAA